MTALGAADAHFFRHEWGRLVAVLSGKLGLQHLELVEDAVQDAFVKATLAWREGLPDNPSAWLTTVASNQAIDLLRKRQARHRREERAEAPNFSSPASEVTLPDELPDAQLRMIFATCDPRLKPIDQVAFALRIVAGFSRKELASALLVSAATVKKRLTRARAAIKKSGLAFEIPQGRALQPRLARVLEVVYLIFNEGFHSVGASELVRRELCGEALRLGRLLIDHPLTAKPTTHALFALMCFHAARLDSKLCPEGHALGLRDQNRELWHQPLIDLGQRVFAQAALEGNFSSYHYEAAIAAEHTRAKTFEETNWRQIACWYEALEQLAPNPLNLLSMAVVQIQLNNLDKARKYIDSGACSPLNAHAYLLHGTLAEWHLAKGDSASAKTCLAQALAEAHNPTERAYLQRKLDGARFQG